MNSRLDVPIAHWRKADNTPQHLRDHLFGVGRLARSFSSKVGLEPAGELIGLLHDLGKYSTKFQGYIRSALGLIDTDEDEYVDAGLLKGKVDHSSAGAQHIWRTLAARGAEESAVAQILALCVASHHSGLIDCISAASANFGEDTFAARMRKPPEKTHLDECVYSADKSVLQRSAELLENRDVVQCLLRLLRKIVERNSIGGKPGPIGTQLHFGFLVRFLFSCLIDADRIDTADFERPRQAKYRNHEKTVDWNALIGRLEAHLGSLANSSPIDDLRRNISNQCLEAASRPAGVYTLTVPTGGGKTLASLRFALHHARQRRLERVIYVVPFTSIIDQNAQVARSILEPTDAPGERGEIVLEHHSNITPEQQTWREKVLCENWDAPVVYTTMVQFLESFFGAGTRGARRMHQLANAILVFDEVQTLPVKCVHLFNNAVNFLTEQCNSTIILCTATQPLLHRVAEVKGAIRLAAKHEIIPDVRALFDNLKRVEVKYQRRPGGWSNDEIAQLALDELRRAGSCLVIVNTKDSARKLYQLCRAQLDASQVLHLSTDMCPAHRRTKLGRGRDDAKDTVVRRLARGDPVLCISTQLIEAGVDVDFGCVIRFLAGLDSIAQAAGRCNRNGRSSIGIVHVVNPTEERLDSLPDISMGRDQAERVLQDFADDPGRYGGNLVGPEAMNDFYRYYFFKRQREMEYLVPATLLGHDDTILNLLASNSQAERELSGRNGLMPNVMLRQSFMTAARAFKSIDAPTQGVVVPYGTEGKDLIGRLHGAFDIELEYELLRSAQQYTVNVFPHVLRQLESAGAVREVKSGARALTLDERYYCDELGLSTEPVSRMETPYA